jgi:type IV secretory pathway VirB2 component (pilin)
MDKSVCKDKSMAIRILSAIIETLGAGTQRAALEAVLTWVRESVTGDVTRMTREERHARIKELLAKAGGIYG